MERRFVMKHLEEYIDAAKRLRDEYELTDPDQESRERTERELSLYCNGYMAGLDVAYALLAGNDIPEAAEKRDNILKDGADEVVWNLTAEQVFGG